MLCKYCHINPVDTSRSICKCTKCLDVAKRYANKYYLDNKDSILKDQKRYYIKNRSYIISRTKSWTKNRINNLISNGVCSSCGEFPIASTSKRFCRGCLDKKKIKAKLYRESNPDKVSKSKKASVSKKPELYRRIKRKYWENNKSLWTGYAQDRRAKKLQVGGNFTRDEWKSLLKFYGNVCLQCGTSKRLEADHVIPISRGGNNSIDNIQPLCRVCNASKSTKIIDFRPFGAFILDWT